MIQLRQLRRRKELAGVSRTILHRLRRRGTGDDLRADPLYLDLRRPRAVQQSLDLGPLRLEVGDRALDILLRGEQFLLPCGQDLPIDVDLLLGTADVDADLADFLQQLARGVARVLDLLRRALDVEPPHEDADGEEDREHAGGELREANQIAVQHVDDLRLLRGQLGGVEAVEVDDGADHDEQANADRGERREADPFAMHDQDDTIRVRVRRHRNRGSVAALADER